MKFLKLIFLICITTIVVMTGCTTVKPWERVYLNDSEMQIGGSSGKTFEDYVHSIRTGSVMAGSKKLSGGCGCN